MAHFSGYRRVASLACAVCLWHANPASAMGLLQAYEAALQNDPQYQSAVSEYQAGQQYAKLGRASLLPTAQYVYSNSHNQADSTAPNFFGQPVTTHPDYKSVTSTISVRQPLFNLDALARYRQGKAQTAYSGAQFASRSQDVMVRLMVAYGDAKFAEEQLRLYTAQRDTFAEQMQVNNRMFEKGEGTKTDMLETQAKLDVSDARVIEATDNLVTARDTLGAMLGQQVTQLDGLANDFSVMPLSPAGFDEWKSNASSQNAEIAAARFELEAAEQEVNKSRAGHMPRLNLNASYSRSKSDSLINLDREATVRSIGVQLVVPLYAGGYVDALTSQALARRDKAQADLDAATNKVMIELHRQYSAVQNSLAKINALQKSVSSATLLVQATQQSVKGGQRINLDVLNAQQQRVAAELELTKARYGYLIGLLKLRMAAGTLNPDDLRAVAAQFSAAD